MDNYNKAYKEITEILKYLPQESIKKIPQLIINAFNLNKNSKYDFSIDLDKCFEEQCLLDETKAILAILFRDYWATPQQNQMIKEKENEDRILEEQEKRKKYSSDIFSTNKTDTKKKKSVECYDGSIITCNTNNINEHLVIKKKLQSIPNEYIRGWYSNSISYDIFTSNGIKIGNISAHIIDRNRIEIKYGINENYRNKGNMSISLEEVLHDIFVEKVLNGMIINDKTPETEIKNVILNINEFNDASQAVAKKNGFKNQGGYYEITEDDFRKRLKERFEKIKNRSGDPRLINNIGQLIMNFSTTSKDLAEKRLKNDVKHLQNNNRMVE